MKITHHWLADFVPVDVTSDELARRLTMAGLEVESVAPVAPPFTDVVVGEVLTATRHPNADKLWVCEVTSDGVDRLQIICGAPNVRPGLKVALALVGAHLPGDVIIGRSTLRGLESFGMLCSARELGLGDEHDGILELPASFELRRSVRAVLDLDDTTLEVNATPNRGDCMSILGVARDYAAATQARYLEYRGIAVAARHSAVFPATIDAAAACPLFGSRIIRGLEGRVSPPWLRERLRRIGIHSISPVVDVTNYVMMELGQPLHAYDLARLSGGITVRMANPGEQVTLLDGKAYTLDPEFLVIADDTGAVGLAGIMGGRDSAISDTTTDVLLEAAHFAPDAIAGRARRAGLFTDAAQRFERGVDPTLPARALERATELLLQITGGEPGPVHLVRAAPRVATGEAGATGEVNWIALRRSRLASLLGMPVADDEVASLLTAVTGSVETTAEGWRVRRPPHRFDLGIEVDLIEEVARLHGFDRIVETHAEAPQIAGAATESRIGPDRLLTAMADAGYREIITYTFVDPLLQRQLFPHQPGLALANPIAPNLSEMRVSLWTGLVQAARENCRRQQPRVRLFEIGRTFIPQTADDVRANANVRETETLAAIATGARLPEQWGSAREALDFFDMKADVMNLLALTGSAAEYRAVPDTLDCLRPGRSARIVRGTTPLGWLGELHPRLSKALGLPANTLLFDLEVNLSFECKLPKYQGMSKFPSIRRDLAVVVDERVPLAVLQENVTVSASGLLSELRVFDVYRGPGVDSGRKSIALGLILQDSSRTLTDVDADAVVTSVVARLRDELSASIRDQ